MKHECYWLGYAGAREAESCMSARWHKLVTSLWQARPGARVDKPILNFGLELLGLPLDEKVRAQQQRSEGLSNASEGLSNEYSRSRQ